MHSSQSVYAYHTDLYIMNQDPTQHKNSWILSKWLLGVTKGEETNLSLLTESAKTTNINQSGTELS